MLKRHFCWIARTPHASVATAVSGNCALCTQARFGTLGLYELELSGPDGTLSNSVWRHRLLVR
jgi:hypothetical protein